MLAGRPMIEHVWRKVNAVLDGAIVATDDRRIMEAVESFGGRAIMTSDSHRSGTDRCAEVAAGIDADVVVNVQGDEPFISADQLRLLVNCFTQPDTQIATLGYQFAKDGDPMAIFDPNVVKLVKDNEGHALYFSRAAIPYMRGVEPAEWLQNFDYFAHMGIYGFRRDTLMQLTALPQSSLEKAESLEQLRWLQNGYRIRVAITDTPGFGIDTPADLEAAEKFMAKLNLS